MRRERALKVVLGFAGPLVKSTYAKLTKNARRVCVQA